MQRAGTIRKHKPLEPAPLIPAANPGSQEHLIWKEGDTNEEGKTSAALPWGRKYIHETGIFQDSSE